MSYRGGKAGAWAVLGGGGGLCTGNAEVVCVFYCVTALASFFEVSLYGGAKGGLALQYVPNTLLVDLVNCYGCILLAYS